MAQMRSVGVRLRMFVDEYARDADRAKRKTDEIGDAGKRTKKSLADMADGMAIAGGILVAAVGVAVVATARFDKQMSEVGAVANATAGELDELRQAALDAGAATAFSASEAAQAEAELAKAGITTITPTAAAMMPPAIAIPSAMSASDFFVRFPASPMRSVSLAASCASRWYSSCQRRRRTPTERMAPIDYLPLRLVFGGRRTFCRLWSMARWRGSFLCASTAASSATQALHTAGGSGSHFQASSRDSVRS